MSKLSLGPVAKPELVKLTVAMPTSLRDDLEQYAELHALTWGAAERMDAATLIPHILTAFLARDRGFQRARRTASGATATPSQV